MFPESLQRAIVASHPGLNDAPARPRNPGGPRRSAPAGGGDGAFFGLGWLPELEDLSELRALI
ncbi:MAG: hypothetical protein QM655_14135 [Nocardioidaceae bacterium]